MGNKGELFEMVPTVVQWSIDYSSQTLVSNLALGIHLHLVTIQILKLIVHVSS